MYERAGDDQLLPHAVAIALHELVRPIIEIEQRHELAAAVVDLVAVLPVQPGNESKKLRARQLLVDERTVRNKSELRFRGERILGKIDAGEVDGPGSRLENAGNH